MIPLGSLSDKPYPSLIQLEPQVPGIFRWLNPKTLSFIPKNRLPYSTEFKAVIQAGTSVLSFPGFKSISPIINKNGFLLILRY